MSSKFKAAQGLALLMLAACERVEVAQPASAAGDCVPQAAVEFGAVPLGATVNAASLPAPEERVRTCFLPNGIEPSGCDVVGDDGIRYGVYDGIISDKVLPLTTPTASRPPLGLTSRTAMAEVKARLVRAGQTPSPHVAEDGSRRLIVSLCPAQDSLRTFSVEFDQRGHARTVVLDATVM